MIIESTLIILVVLAITNIVLIALLIGRIPQKGQLKLEEHFGSIEKNQEKFERLLRDELAKNREEASINAMREREEASKQAQKEREEMSLQSQREREEARIAAQREREEINNVMKLLRDEINNTLKLLSDSILSRMTEIATLQKNQFDIFSSRFSNLLESHEKRLLDMRQTIEERLKSLQEDNSLKLEAMRATVDEKLHATLENRLGESFKLVSERLELVHKGLGEMQALAGGVGDLKKVLTNVKTRGVWGEVHLGNLLEQILTPEQYEKNVFIKKGGREHVEFAIKLPGKNHGVDAFIWLPIDAKFPLEVHQRLQDALDSGNSDLAEKAAKELEKTIKDEAGNIRDKYLDPPNTTDFGIMFLPTEGLYAEVLRRAGLWEVIQRDYKVVVTGPTTLAAILNSLQIGFRTLTIEKRSSEVWMLLGAIKTQFARFGDALEKTQKKLHEASSTIEEATKKSRTIERRLKDVEAFPISETNNTLETDLEFA